MTIQHCVYEQLSMTFGAEYLGNRLR